MNGIEINPLYGLSYEDIKRRIKDLIQGGQLPKSWKDFYQGSTGSAISELLAALSLMINYEVSKAREEAYLTTATLESSVLHAAATLGYPVNRERAMTVKVKVGSNPLRGVRNEPLEQLLRDYSFDIFPGSYDEGGRPRYGRVLSPVFATYEQVPMSLSPIDEDTGDISDSLVLIPQVVLNSDGEPLYDRPDIAGFRNWKEVTLTAGVWVRNVMRAEDIIRQGGRVVIRESVDNDRILIRVYDEYSQEEPTIVRTTKYFEETLPTSPQQDRRSLPVFELTMPYGVVLFFGKFFGFPLSPNAVVIIDYLVPYPYNGSFNPYALSLSHPGFQVLPTGPEYGNDLKPPIGDGEERRNVYRLSSLYSSADSLEKVKYTALGYRAAHRRVVTLNDYKYAMLSWRGDIVDAKASLPGQGSQGGGGCCQVNVSYVSIFFDEAGVVRPRLLLPDEKVRAQMYISERGIAGVTVRIVDPEYRDFYYRARMVVDARRISRVQEAVSEYFNRIVPSFENQLKVGKITVDLSRIPGVKRIYPLSQDPENLGEYTVLVPRQDIIYEIEE